MRRKKAAAGFLILSLCAGASLHRIQAGSFGGFEIDVEEGADSQQWNEEDMGSAQEGENTEETGSDQNTSAPSGGEAAGSGVGTESAGGVGTESTGGGKNGSAGGGRADSAGSGETEGEGGEKNGSAEGGRAESAGSGETESAGGKNAGNTGGVGTEGTGGRKIESAGSGETEGAGGKNAGNVGGGNAESTGGNGTESAGNDGKNLSILEATAGAGGKKNPKNADSVTNRAGRNSSQLIAVGPVIASTGISLLSTPLKYYNNINNNKKKGTKYKEKYTEKEIFQDITEKTENGMVNITLFQDVDITIVSLRLNGQEASWHWEEGKIFLDSPVSKKDSTVEMAVLVNGSQILFSPVWKIL